MIGRGGRSGERGGGVEGYVTVCVICVCVWVSCVCVLCMRVCGLCVCMCVCVVCVCGLCVCTCVCVYHNVSPSPPIPPPHPIPHLTRTLSPSGPPPSRLLHTRTVVY